MTHVIQTEFQKALLDPVRDRPDGLNDGHGRPAGKRFDVYRNNVAVSLTEALQTAFPVIVKLVGANNFKLLAGAFLRLHPPSSPVMMLYGTEMPAFLASFEPAKSLAYLPDVARLELALRASYHAADATSIDTASLKDLTPDALTNARLTLAPSVRLVRSRWPVHSIWRFNAEDDAPKPSMRAEDVLVLRPSLDPEPHLLPEGGGVFVERLFQGATLGEAHDAATAEAPGFDLSSTLTLLFGAAAVTSLGD